MARIISADTWYLAPMLYTTLAAGLVCLLSGLLLGFASKYGVLRSWWVGVKLLLNVVMSVVLLPCCSTRSAISPSAEGRSPSSAPSSSSPPSQSEW